MKRDSITNSRHLVDEFQVAIDLLWFSDDGPCLPALAHCPSIILAYFQKFPIHLMTPVPTCTLLSFPV